MTNMQSKVVVITGASEGLGKALAHNLSDKLHYCVLFARTEKKLARVANEISGYVVGDVSNFEDICRLRDETIDKYGHIDVWINNAGIWKHRPVEENTPEDIKQIFEVNTFGLIYGSQVAYAHMKERNSGTIVNIISTSGQIGRKNESIYCASKFAASGFTKSLQDESKGTGVRVIDVYQGGMNTGFFENENKAVDSKTFMNPYDVAKLIVSAVESPNNIQSTLVINRR